MKLTGIQKDMIQWRLEECDAVAEVLEDSLEYKWSYAQCLDWARAAEQELLGKLMRDEPLRPYEDEIVLDIAGCCSQYADMAAADVGFSTSRQKAAAIAASILAVTEAPE